MLHSGEFMVDFTTETLAIWSGIEYLTTKGKKEKQIRIFPVTHSFRSFYSVRQAPPRFRWRNRPNKEKNKLNEKNSI